MIKISMGPRIVSGCTLDKYFSLEPEKKKHICTIAIKKTEDLINNLEALKKDSNIKKDHFAFYCDSFETVLLLDEHNLLHKTSDVYLIDDLENKDRSYIDTRLFKNDFRFTIPISYVMWNVNFEDKISYSSLMYNSKKADEFGDIVSNRREENNEFFDHKTILEIKRLAEMMSQVNNGNLSDIEKVLILSSFFQANMQYVLKHSTTVQGETFVVEAIEKELENYTVGSAETPLFDYYGICRSFADLTTLLGNNPYLNLDLRNVSGNSHAWNYIIIDGKCYYIDNTRAISRNAYRHPEALKAQGFDAKYLLFGQDDAEILEHEKIKTHMKQPLNKESIDRGLIEAMLDYFWQNELLAFDYSSVEPHFKSTISR